LNHRFRADTKATRRATRCQEQAVGFCQHRMADDFPISGNPLFLISCLFPYLGNSQEIATRTGTVIVRINNYINKQANHGAIIAYGLIAMNRSDLIARLAESHPQLQIKDAELGAKVIIDALSNTLVKGERVEIRGFGSFFLNYRSPRQGRNPKTGGKVQVPAKYVPHFKAGRELRERVDSY